jgi:hypothetical protein
LSGGLRTKNKRRKQELWLLNLVIKLVAFDEDTNWGLDEKNVTWS